MTILLDLVLPVFVFLLRLVGELLLHVVLGIIGIVTDLVINMYVEDRVAVWKQKRFPKNYSASLSR